MVTEAKLLQVKLVQFHNIGTLNLGTGKDICMWYTVMNYHISNFDTRKLYGHFEELQTI